MSKKPRILVAILFMYVSLICVGFSAWTISNSSNSENVEGMMTAEEAYSTTNFLTYNTSGGTSGIEQFSYYNTGFVADDGSVVLAGSIKINYNLNIGASYNYFGNEYNKVSVNVALRYKNDISNQSDFNFFNNDNITIQVLRKQQNSAEYVVVSNPIRTNNNISVTLPFDIAENGGSVNFELEFKFIVNSNEYFKDNVYPFLRENSSECFTVSASVEGSEPKGGA